MIEQVESKFLATEPAIVEELASDLDPWHAFLALSEMSYPVFLDSSLQHHSLGRYSYVTADPFQTKLVQRAGLQELEELNQSIASYRTRSLPDLAPFQGGLIHLISYSLHRCLETIPDTRNEFEIPDLFYGLYDFVLIFDHDLNRNWLVSQGFPETEPKRRKSRAEIRTRTILDQLNNLPSGPRDLKQRQPKSSSLDSTSLPESEITGTKPSAISNRLVSNFSKQEYIEAVQKCIDYIHDGDIFQVNLSQRLLCRQSEASVEIYGRLRENNQATFAAYLDLGDIQILSSSPERLLSIDSKGQVETRPIKGTRPRSCYPEANLFSAEGLISSEKDRSENVMIVDLLRNDLSKFCEDDSIQVSKLWGIESYEYVQHLVSVIQAKVRSDTQLSAVIRSLFPGGSITGAPKVRAMEIIAEIERVSRGVYCGSLGFQSFDGSIDQNILIRTITAAKGWLQIPVGGGVVSQSDPLSEYEETVHKAHGMLKSIF